MANYLVNPSFEEGWAHPDCIPELQIPYGWQFKYFEDDNPFDPHPFVRPEVNVLPYWKLPEHEQDLLVRHGNYTLKIAKGNGAWHASFTQIARPADGRYQLIAFVFGDLVKDYVNGEKIWADDPLAGRLRFIVNNKVSKWVQLKPGAWKRLTVKFDVKKRCTYGVEIMCPFPLKNSGVFMDDWRMVEVEEQEPPAPQPEPNPKPNCVISIHRQTDEDGIQNFLGKVQPEWMKVVNGMEDARKYKDWGAKNVDVRIPVGNSKQYIDSMDVTGYLAHFDQALEANMEWVDAIEDLNEENPADPKMIEFLIAMSNEVKRRYGDSVKVASGNWAVGNGEGEQLLEWARTIANNGHLAAYHCYHPVNIMWAEEWMETEARWYHLRNLLHLDPYFASNGIFIDWIGTEAGAVEGVPLEGIAAAESYDELEDGIFVPRVARLDDEWRAAKAAQRKALSGGILYAAMLESVGPLDPTGGWRCSDALNGDLVRYIRLQKQMELMITAWNALNGNRMRGTCIFTVGANYVGWNNFKLWKTDLDAFAEAFAA